MRRKLASSLLSFLLLTTLVWGGCISCEQYFMFPGAKGCCDPSGHCKSKAPAKHAPDRDCKQIAFDHQKSLDLHIDLPVASALAFDAPALTVEPVIERHGPSPVDPSPPDLQILNSTFLI